MVTAMSSPIFSDAVQNSVFQVISEGSLKAVARPALTLVDKNGTPDSRRYSATKELIFQTMSIAFYFALVATFVQKGGYKLLRKMFQNKPNFEKMKEFKDLKGFLDARAAADGTPDEVKFIRPKGAIEAFNMLGSGIILTVLAPKFVTLLVHPIMWLIDKQTSSKKTVQKNNHGDVLEKSNQV